MTALDFPDWNTGTLSAGASYQVLAQTLAVPSSGSVESNIVFAGAFPSVLLELSTASLNPFTGHLSWYADPAGSILLWQEPTISKAGAGANYAVYSVKGPYLAVTLFGGGAGTDSVGVQVNGSHNGSNPGDVFAPQVLSEGSAISVGAGATDDIALPTVIPGPAILWGQAATTGNINVQHWNGTAWVDLQQLTMTTNVSETAALVLPSDDCRVQLISQGAAAANFFYSLQHGG